jgi:tetratricopeptide (TPR) repeat protein
MRFSAAPSLFVFASLLAPLPSPAQSSDATHIESAPELIARLTPDQKQQYDAAVQNFNGQNYADALVHYKALLKELPNDPILLKFSSESALNTGDTTYALNNLKPVVQANPDDWQAAGLLTRAYAESGDKINRDAGIAHMIELHKRGLTPPHLQQYLLEHVTVGGKTVLIFTSLEPWGHYKVYNYAQVYDENAHLAMRLTLESNDTDQPLFARQHSKEAAAGTRLFSIDGYGDSAVSNDGQRTESHATYKFFTGQPSYDTVRETFLSIASANSNPVSSRTNTQPQ